MGLTHLQPSAEQQAIIDAVAKGENIFITGVAGTGKSFVIDQIRERYPVAVTATTGIAALNVGGSTIHTWAGLGDGSMDPASIAGRIRNTTIPWIAPIRNNIVGCKILVIDEVSMLSAKMLNTIDFVFRNVRDIPLPFGGIQIILTGDFLQLPPVTKDLEDPESGEFCYKAKAWHDANIRVCQLTKVFRQQNQFFADALGRIRMGEPLDSDCVMLMQREGVLWGRGSGEDVDPIRVFGTNAMADTLNYECLTKLNDCELTYMAEDVPKAELSEKQKQMYSDKMNRDCLAPKALLLKVDAQVMLLRNINVEAGLVNGSMGRVMDFDESGQPIVKFTNGRQVTIKKESWELKEGLNLPNQPPDVVYSRRQYPLRLAWGITIHKCQGMSLDRVYCDLSRIFAEGQAYVALSRAKTLEGLFLSGFNRSKIFANKSAVRFYKELNA